MLKLKQRYIDFLEKQSRNFPESIFYYFLYLVSGIYWLVVALRNFFYDGNFFSSYRAQARVISVGNLSWAGSGKTSLVIWLKNIFSGQLRTAVLRRGYGRDEGKLLSDAGCKVFSSPDRLHLAKELEPNFELFILDDAFQYRRLQRTVDIVVMGARDFRHKPRLIPAYIFREPLTSLKRADIVVVNYSDEISDRDSIVVLIKKFSPQSQLFFSHYQVKSFYDLQSNSIDLNWLRGKKIAAFTAIGYPQGFFNKLEEAGLEVLRKFIYPDHYELKENEYLKIENELLLQGISYLIITAKDKYHFSVKEFKMNIIVMEITLEIENSKAFVELLQSKLTAKFI